MQPLHVVANPLAISEMLDASMAPAIGHADGETGGKA